MGNSLARAPLGPAVRPGWLRLLRRSAPLEKSVASADEPPLFRFGQPALQRVFHGMEDYEKARAHLEIAAAKAHLGEDGALVGEAFPVCARDLRM